MVEKNKTKQKKIELTEKTGTLNQKKKKGKQ